MKILLVAGHGQGYMSNDPGATANGYNERDFTRKYIVPTVAKYLKQAGHKVYLYGGTKMSQDLFQDTAYGQQVGNDKDYGMYWVSRQSYDVVVEFHLDAAGSTASGGHVIIGYGLEADEIDEGIQTAIKKHVGVIRGIDRRDNLLNVNIAKDYGVNYRLVELGFITSKKDMDYISKKYDSYCKDIADAIHGKEIPVLKPAKKPVAANTHTVKKGETLWSISKKYNMSVVALSNLNKMKSTTVKVGQTLKVNQNVNTLKKKAPAKITAAKNTKTQAQAVTYTKSLVGKGWDYDDYAGWQCFDVANYYWDYLFGHGLKGDGAKDIPTWNNFDGEATVHINTPEFLAQPGDLVVWGAPYGNGWGHVAIVLEATLDSLYVVEQNWFNGGANKKEVAAARCKEYDANMWFIRPIFKQ